MTDFSCQLQLVYLCTKYEQLIFSFYLRVCVFAFFSRVCMHKSSMFPCVWLLDDSSILQSDNELGRSVMRKGAGKAVEPQVCLASWSPLSGPTSLTHIKHTYTYKMSPSGENNKSFHLVLWRNTVKPLFFRLYLLRTLYQVLLSAGILNRGVKHNIY